MYYVLNIEADAVPGPGPAPSGISRRIQEIYKILYTLKRLVYRNPLEGLLDPSHLSSGSCHEQEQVDGAQDEKHSYMKIHPYPKSFFS